MFQAEITQVIIHSREISFNQTVTEMDPIIPSQEMNPILAKLNQERDFYAFLKRVRALFVKSATK